LDVTLATASSTLPFAFSVAMKTRAETLERSLQKYIDFAVAFGGDGDKDQICASHYAIALSCASLFEGQISQDFKKGGIKREKALQTHKGEYTKAVSAHLIGKSEQSFIHSSLWKFMIENSGTAAKAPEQ
jgi:hypothetical protein